METIEYKYKKLRVAQDLTKKVIGTIGMKLMRKNKKGIFELPPEEEIYSYLNTLAENRMIKHYILEGVNEKVYLFDADEILDGLEILEIEAKKVTEVIKIQCYDEKVKHSDNIPIEISRIEELYRVPKSLFNSGSCIYFLCKNEKVVYVGQAENIHQRLIEHQKNKVFDDVYYIRVSAHKMSKVEAALISYLKPEYNKSGVSSPLTNQKISLSKSILNTNKEVGGFI